MSTIAGQGPGKFDDAWLCERHARPIILRDREEELLSSDDLEVVDPNADPDGPANP
ncbi:hypothetical protein ACQ143_00155 [Microbacterium sp. MC2]